MGLDMYLNGKKYIRSNYENPDDCLKEDGFRVEEKILRLGYWRKHPNLHGFIVKYFADGVDECQPIELDKDKLELMIDAIKRRDLPETSGFFFGKSDMTAGQAAEDIDVLKGAIKWLEAQPKTEWRSVVYRASW